MDKIYYQGNTLYHHGILGQKWGVRRFQNADGTYTSAGKERRRSDEYSSDEKRKRELQKKPSSQLSNKELEELNRRLNLETQRQNYERNGRNKVRNILQDTANTIQSALTFIAVSGNAIAVGKRIIEDLAWRNVGK